ncbi:efflux RND transporter permease subunit [Undibacterium sp.]|jgi:CzcA family heavy metal efflux pump|uniref:efflux RND transporter permease subunit n=1 Tax=Undibacterium sp. TaxID=1914977 RepID=UPI002C3FAFA6|nr:efflux RND transporter permease subunit [Undibacterium sp.]HTD07187.1 efflux RND transporter permease subunit [Undibacterium sp.]
MSVSTWTQSHRRSLLFLLMMLAIAGVVAAFKLPVSLFPTVDFPRAVVALDAGDQPAEQMEMLVTRPVEEAVRRVPGVRNVRSTTSRGSAEISVNFDWGRDMASSALQINAAIAQILAQLPAGTQVSTRQMDPTVFPIIAYSLTAASLSPTQLRDLAEYELRPLLSSVDGVSRVQVLGGAIEEYRVTVDPMKLKAYDLTFDDVSKTLASTNVVSAVGRLEDHYKLYLAISNTRLQNIEQVRQSILRNQANGMVRLSDVAVVEQSTVPGWTRVTADGKNAVLFSVYQQPGSNSVQIATDIKEKLSAYRSQLPAGVKIANWYDQSQLVLESASSVRDAVLIGIALSALVLLFFLRNLKVTLIAIVVVPAVLSTTVVLLYVLGMSFNIMTLGGMAAAVGLIIDDAIVMIEHIIRRLQGGDGQMHERVMSAAIEFIRPLAGSSASTLVIFAPLAFLSGVTGAFFKALSLTMAAALFISFLITWLAVPLLADRFLNEKDAEHEVETRLIKWLHARYERLLRTLLDRPVLILAGIIPMMAIGWIAFQHVGSGFMPSMDEGGFVLDYQSAPGTALTETDRLLRQVEEIVKTTPDVETYSRRTGTGLGGGLSEANQGDFFVRLKPFPRRPVDEVMDDIRTKVEHNVPGLKIEMAQLMEDLIGDLTAVPQPIEIKLFAENPAQLGAVAKKVADKIAKINGIVDVKNGINPAGDALDIHIDAIKATVEGMDADSITKSINNALTGNVATQITGAIKTIGVRVWVPKSLRNTDTDLGNLLIRAPDGHAFPLKRVASITAVSGQPQISRENLKRMVAVTGRISGRDLGSAIADVKTVMAQQNLLPKGGYYLLGGLYEQQQIAFQGLMAVFAAASALVFLLLLFMYESFRLAIAILSTALLAVSTVFIGLWLTHTELNISAMMGMTMIIGMVTEVAIFYFSEQQELVAYEDLPVSIINAGINRMRPIAMTTIAAILTLLPLAFAIGQGSEMQQPLAIAIISGLIFQLPLVLLVMPVLFYLMRDKKKPDISNQ